MTFPFFLFRLYSATPLLAVGFINALILLLYFLVFLSIGFYPKSYTKSGKGLFFLACPNMLILGGVYTHQSLSAGATAKWISPVLSECTRCSWLPRLPVRCSIGTTTTPMTPTKRFAFTAAIFRSISSKIFRKSSRARSVNGKKQEVSATPCTYVMLDRQWKDGDKIEVSLPMKLHVAPIPDDASLQAMMYGPLVLAGRLGTADLSKDLIYGPSAPDKKKTIPVPEITASGKDPTGWVEPAKDERLAFRTVGQSENFATIPLYKLFNERYTVYWKVHGKTA